jgi:hypothetical protein
MGNSIERIKKAQHKSGYFNERIVRQKNWLSLMYWRYRVLRPLIKLKYKTFRKKHYPSPWLTPGSILFFEEWLTKDMKGAEYGSGISTLFFAKRSKQVVSIEHYKPWHDKVVDLFQEENITNVDYKFISPEEELRETYDTSVFEQFDLMQYSDFILWKYAPYYSALNSFSDSYFDYIIVDGRARPECVFHAIAKLKQGGLMVLDNSERSRYSIVFDRLSSWSNFTTSNGLTNTTFWVKP